ncbi:MAG TPA: hypothetical protein VFN67_09910 [Polyangiales bacterium]|nr:hypothetical protein [Polyangiales bacterium]
MVRFRLSGLVFVCVLAQLLAAPALGIVLQDESQLADFHNHALAPWPSSQLLAADPSVYFQGARTWLTERIFPVQLATRIQKTVLLNWLNEAPEPRISLGDDGHIFLNGGSNQSLYGLFALACVYAHTDAAARSLEQAMQYWTSLGLPSDFVVIPTAASLYADKLPSSTPQNLRTACLERTAGRSALLSVRAPEKIHFLYPLHEMLAAKDDAGFYPKANWHAAGKSLQLVRDTYLAQLGVQQRVQESLRRGSGPAEILLSYGIDWERPRYFVDNPAVSTAAHSDALVRSALAPFFRGNRFVTHAYENTLPVLDQHVLLLTDSFGDLAAEVFAGAFRSVVQVNVNDLQAGGASFVIQRVRETQPIDRVIFLIQEGNVASLALWR